MTLLPGVANAEPRQGAVHTGFDKAIGMVLSSTLEIEDADRAFDERLHERVVSGLELAHPIMAALVSELAPRIKEGRWTAVLGDDSKGRLPALITGDIMRRWADEHSEPAPARRFIAGGRVAAETDSGAQVEAFTAIKLQNLKKRITKIKPELGRRTLLVTEFTARNGIIPLLQAMQESETPFDLAVVQTREALEAHKQSWQERRPGILDGVEVFTGQSPADGNGPVFAVDTLGNGLIHATGVRRAGLESIATLGPKDLRPHVVFARNGAEYMADQLYGQFF